MEAEESQDLQSASWIPQRAGGVVPVQCEGLRTRREEGVKASPNPSGTVSQEEPISQFLSEGRQGLMSQVPAAR